MKKEKLLNIPNAITTFRIPLTILAIALLFQDYSRLLVAIIFGIAALTDFFDGYFARKLNQCTKFGSWFDLISDRLFIALTFISLIFYFMYSNSQSELILLFMTISREIIGSIGCVIRKIRKISIYGVNMIGKIQTTLQAIAIALLIWGIPLAKYLVIITFIFGILSGGDYLINSIKRKK
jgi:CDP-diacylglycerol---glycerol-3-phosphate 3-phosphatidyltransferase